MKRKKLGIMLIFSLLLCMFSMPVLAAENSMENDENIAVISETQDNITWKLDEDGTLTISGSGELSEIDLEDTSVVTKLVINEGITSISNYVFSDYDNLVIVTLPKSVTNIDYGNFYSSWYDELIFRCIKDSYAHSYAIENGHHVEAYASLKNAVTTGKCGNNISWTWDEKGTLTLSGTDTMPIGDYFDNIKVGIFKIVVNNGITSICTDAFTECYNLKEVVLPESLTYIGNSAFSGCVELSSIAFPSTMTYIGDSAFYDCDSLTELFIPAGIIKICSSTFSGCDNVEKVTIPNGVTEIGSSAFSGCDNLTDVNIPGSVTTIVGGTFSDCTSLERIIIPNSVTTIGYSTFRDCSNLKEITLPDSITDLGWNTFSGCTSLEKIILPKKITYIADSMFSECNSLKEITIPDGVTGIDYHAFSGCSSLEEITIPEGVTSIGWNAFYGCSSLTKVVVPKSLKTIGDEAFKECSSLKSITLPGCISEIGVNAFAGCADNFKIYYYNNALVKAYVAENGLAAEWVNPVKDQVNRIYGANRYETAFNIADAYKKQLGIDKFDAIIVASGKGFADALPGSYLSSAKNAPILMTNGKNVKELCDYIAKNLNKDGDVYLLGGENAVSWDVQHAIWETCDKIEGWCSVTRLSGENRYETNLAILNAVSVENNDILVCTGRSFADSLSASASKKPILLVGKKLTSAQIEFLSSLSGNKFYIIGGESAVSKEIEMQISSYGVTERIGGNTRYETSVLFAEKFFEEPQGAVLAYAKNYPDGLCGGPLAVSMNAPLILTMTNKETEAVNYVKEHNLNTGAILGGDGLISEGTVNNIFH